MWTETCDMNECCCREENGWDGRSNYQLQTCKDQQDGTAIGCFACSGIDACNQLTNSKVGDYGCVGRDACNANNLVVGREACHGIRSCFGMENVRVGNDRKVRVCVVLLCVMVCSI